MCIKISLRAGAQVGTRCIASAPIECRKHPNDQTTKQPNNQTTKQPNDQTTKQPNNQTTKQPNNQTTKLYAKCHLAADSAEIHDSSFRHKPV